MFNRVAQQETVTAHNIRDSMSRSRKRSPITCWVKCKSQKRGKQICGRKFRRRVHQFISVGKIELLPFLAREVMESWDLGGDGKGYIHADSMGSAKMMRK